LVSSLPEDATIEEATATFYLFFKVKTGCDQADSARPIRVRNWIF